MIQATAAPGLIIPIQARIVRSLCSYNFVPGLYIQFIFVDTFFSLWVISVLDISVILDVLMIYLLISPKIVLRIFADGENFLRCLTWRVSHFSAGEPNGLDVHPMTIA